MHANYTEQERISRIKKAYSTLANAMTRVKADGGDTVLDASDKDSTTYSELKSWYKKSLSPYLITTKVCYEEAGCWNKTGTKYLNGDSAGSSKGVGTNIITAVLNDGTYINIDFWLQEDIVEKFGVDTECYQAITIYFDINGDKKPNTFGKDIFVAIFDEDGLVMPFKDREKSEMEIECSSSGRGYSCINKYMQK